MISRRNIRVKVMQTLYILDSVSGENKPGEAQAILTKKIEQTRVLFTYLNLFYLGSGQVCRERCFAES